MRLTRRGWLALGAAVGLLVSWMLFGEIELASAGGMLAAAVAAGWLFVVVGRPSAAVRRRISPTVVTEDEQTVIEVEIHPHRRLRNSTVIDRVGSLGAATFRVASLRSVAVARYRVECTSRGVYPVGPVLFRVEDPLGLVSAETEVGVVDRLIVYPRVERLAGLPTARGIDPTGQVAGTRHSRRGGEDFYTLREYVIGDDLRRVHWPSSAKRDELMIRQLETPWRARALILFDRRRRSYQSLACFEMAVRGTASVVVHMARAGFDAELWMGDTWDVGDFSAVMEQLALAEPVPHLDVRGAAVGMKRRGGGGVLVIVTGIPDAELLEAHRLLGRDHRTTVVMSAAHTSASTDAAFNRVGAHTVVVPPDGSWATAWRRMVDRAWRGISAG